MIKIVIKTVHKKSTIFYEREKWVCVSLKLLAYKPLKIPSGNFEIID